MKPASVNPAQPDDTFTACAGGTRIGAPTLVQEPRSLLGN